MLEQLQLDEEAAAPQVIDRVAMIQRAGGKNPAQAVERYRERAWEIRFLTLALIDEELAALALLADERKWVRTPKPDREEIVTSLMAGLLRGCRSFLPIEAPRPVRG